MTLISPSGDQTGAADLAAINAMTPDDMLSTGTYYVNDTITAAVIRGVDWAHWEAFFPGALTTIMAVDGTYSEGAALVNHAQGFYQGFTLDCSSVTAAGFNGAEISGSKELTFDKVHLTGGTGVGLKGSGTDDVLGLRFCQSRIQGWDDWGVDIGNMSDSSFYGKFDVSSCGRGPQGQTGDAGGIIIRYGTANAFLEGEIQDIYSNGPGLRIDGGGGNRIAFIKFDQCGSGDIFLNCEFTTIVGCMDSFATTSLHMGPRAVQIISMGNCWFGDGVYKGDPRDSSVPSLLGKFDDMISGTPYADADTQAIMAGMVR